MERFVAIYKYFLIALSISLFLFIFYQYFAINGELSFKYNLCDKPSMISALTPQGRVLNLEQNLETGDCYQRIAGEPVYFSASVPRSFNIASATLVYRNPEQRIIELGIKKSLAENYELHSLENKFIDDSLWYRLEKENTILLQKNKKYNSLEEFTSNIPTDAKIATYHYSPKYNFKIDNYTPSNKEMEINKALRGKHEFYTYIKNEDLDFTFYYQDLNWAYPSENFVVRVYKGGTELNTFFEPSSTVSEPKEKRIQMTGLGEGVYKIVLDNSDDMIVTKIKTKQHLLVAKDKLYLANNEIYKSTIKDLNINSSQIYSNSNDFIFKTDHENGLQTIKINDEDFSIFKISGFLTWQPENYLVGSEKTLSVPQNDLLIQGHGHFAFSEESFFDPDFGIDPLLNNIDIEQYDYIIAADYSAPLAQNSWKSATADFNLDGVSGDRKTLNFVISAPGLSEAEDDIIIKEIDIQLQRDPLTLERIFNKVSNK